MGVKLDYMKRLRFKEEDICLINRTVTANHLNSHMFETNDVVLVLTTDSDPLCGGYKNHNDRTGWFVPSEHLVKVGEL